MICLFHKWKLVGLCYEEYSPKFENYGIKTYEVEKCDKCNRKRLVQIDKYTDIYLSMHEDRIKKLENERFESINKYRQAEIENNLKG